MKAFSINIVGLSLDSHTFDFKLGDEFLDRYGRNIVPAGDFTANVVLNKHESFIEAEFLINGTARLTCDRSLEEFDYPIRLDRKILFKYGEETMELSDEIMMIHRDTAQLDLGQLMYEFIGLEIPMKKLHPRFSEEYEEEDDEVRGKIVYTSSPEEKKADQIDPRWEKLKKLK